MFVSGTGPMTMAASLCKAFLKTRPELATPNIQFHILPFSADNPADGPHRFHAFTASVLQMRPESAGHLALKSADPLEAPEDPEQRYTGPPKRKMASALISITIADASMSLDNVLAVAAIADGDKNMLIFGLGIASLLMAFAATMIMRLLATYPWISWLDLLVLVLWPAR